MKPSESVCFMLYRKLQSHFWFRPVITSHLIITDACFLYIDIISFFFHSLICLFTDQISKFGRSSKINFFVKRMWSKHSILPGCLFFFFFFLKVLITRKRKKYQKTINKSVGYCILVTMVFLFQRYFYTTTKNAQFHKKTTYFGKGKTKKYNFNWNVFAKPATK